MKQRKQSEISMPNRKEQPALLRITKKLWLPFLIFCWPMLYLFRQVFVINGSYTAIINDFMLLYYKYKVYLLDSLANYHLPLWSPSEAAGFPFYTSPFAQVFYPFNVLLVIWYKAFAGYSPLDHQLFTVLGISIFALGLFVWLRLINKDIKAVIFAVFVMSVSFKVTEITRLPNAVHTMAWYPWILYALTRIIFSGSAKETVKSAALLAVFGIFLCTAGYPYFVYYTIFLFVPYMLVFFIKPLRIKLFGERPVYFARPAIAIISAGFTSLLVCAPYLIGIKRLMAETTDRAGKDLDFSTYHIFDFEDTVGSFVYPPAASTEGWYFFSITALLIICIYLFTKTDNKRLSYINGYPSQDLTSITVKLFFIIWIALVSYITYGKSSYLFILFWKYMPGFSSLRVWGRLNIILVPIIAWLLSISFTYFCSIISSQSKSKEKFRWFSSSFFVLAVVYAGILAVQLYLHFKAKPDEMWELFFKPFRLNELLFIFFGIIAFILILFLMAAGAKNRFSSGKLNAITALLILMAAIETWHTGASQWSKNVKNSPQKFKLNIAALNETSFGYPRIDITNTITLSPSFNVGTMPNWYFSRYINFLNAASNETLARDYLLGIQNGQKIFFSDSIGHPDIESFLKDALQYKQAGRLISYNGDQLNWEIDTPKAGYLSFIDNWDADWKASVDGKPAQIEVLFGTFKSVYLDQGKHKIRFYYQPGLFPAITVKKD